MTDAQAYAEITIYNIPESCSKCAFCGYKELILPMRVCFLDNGAFVPDYGRPRWCPFGEAQEDK